MQADEQEGAEREIDRRALLEDAADLARPQRESSVAGLDLDTVETLVAEVVRDVRAERCGARRSTAR